LSNVGRRLVAGLAILVLGLCQTSSVSAASSQTPETFADVLSRMQLVVVADVTGSTETGFTYSVETFLKGTSARTLQFGPDLQAAVEPGWTRVVLAFSNLTTDDFRAPTIAWHIGPDGTIDPEGYQQYVGLPRTLTAMLAYFGGSSGSTAPSSPITTPQSSPATSPPAASSAATPSPEASVAAAPGAAADSSYASWALIVLIAGGAVLLGTLALRRSRDTRAG
jgi:hypothetical protein